MTPIICCGFECGASGTGTHWTVGTGSPTFDTSTFRNGLTAARINPTAAAARLGGPGSGLISGGIWVERFAVYFASLPAADTFIAGVANGTSGPGVRFKQSDSKLYAATNDGAGGGNFGATGVAVTTGQWYYVDVKSNCSANPHTVDVNVNGSACAQVTRGVAADTGASTGYVGTGSLDGFATNETATMDVYFDDVIQSSTAADYPIGDGKVLGYWPTSDGTHTTTTTHMVKGTTAAPTGGGAITSATTDAYQWVDGTTISNTADFWNFQTASSLEYGEVAFATTAEIPRGVEAVIALSAATTAANTQKAVLWDGTTASDIYASGTVGVQHPTLTYKRKMYAAAPTGAWSVALFNATRVRWGYSGDATPDAYCDNILLEVEYAIVAAAAVPYSSPYPQILAQ